MDWCRINGDEYVRLLWLQNIINLNEEAGEAIIDLNINSSLPSRAHIRPLTSSSLA